MLFYPFGLPRFATTGDAAYAVAIRIHMLDDVESASNRTMHGYRPI